MSNISTDKNTANIYNIASNYNFLESLASWVLTNFSLKGPLNLILPNRRSCREFHKILSLKLTKEQKMPKIKAIADIEFSDFSYFLKDIDLKDKEVNILSDFDYLFFLSEEIMTTQVFGENINFSQAFTIATSLKNLFDEIDREEIEIERLYEIDDTNLSEHRQFTLNFLKKFYLRVKNKIQKNNIYSKVKYQNLVIDTLTKLIAKQELCSPMIIAGSTGSVNFSKKLMKALSHAKNGHVIIYGFDKNANVQDKNHPQYILYELLNFINIKADYVKEIADNKLKLCHEQRIAFIAQTMLPSAQSYEWQNLDKKIDLDQITLDLKNNFSYIETKNEISEVDIIVDACTKALKNNKNVGIIVNDAAFSALICEQFKKLAIDFNDARSLDIFNSKIINLIILLLELLESDFDSHNLLAVLKHPLVKKDENEKLLADFEIKILRTSRPYFGLKGILESLNYVDDDLKKFFNDFLSKIAPIKDLSHVDLAKFFNHIIQAIQNLSQKTLSDIINNEDAKKELTELFEKIKNKHEFILNKSDALRFFTHIFAQISYFKESNPDAQIQLISTIEARLLNFDLLILPMLNQGDFPQIESENWLGRKIKNALGLDLINKKYIQNAYDFSNYLANKTVILTRSQSKLSSLTLQSPFILRLEILAKKIGLSIKQEAAQVFPQIDIKKSECKISFKKRLKKLAITDIHKLINDPYQIYAKRILQLKELNKIDYEPEFKEFGSFIHKALEEYIKNEEPYEIFIKKAEKIFENYFHSAFAKLLWWSKFENLFKNFLLQNNKLKIEKNYVEVPVKIMINDILINGKIDRVTLNENNGVALYDYKTGQLPSNIEVENGYQPQLTLSALMLILGKIEDKNLAKISVKKIESLNYWKLPLTNISEIKNVANNSDEIALLVAAAKSGLENLLQYYQDEKNYFSCDNNFDITKNEYAHLARIF